MKNISAQKISGSITDTKSGELLIGAVVLVKGTQDASITDVNGKFEIVTHQKLPVVLVFSLIGYEPQEVTIKSFDKPVIIKLRQKDIVLKNVEVTGSRISEKQKEAPLTVESIDRIAIKECAQTSFYEALGTLKGVDLTSASLGFTIINTRGFNSTSPVRSLQIIDGVDNQAPGLNFSLGNFLGCSELDVLKVDLIAGASSAYFGPNAFNGVISMTTRSPFVKPGLEVMSKVGERNMFENAIRWAHVFSNKKGEEKFAYKLCFYYMQAKDWEANNLDVTPQSLNNKNNPGGYDAVNRYGDEYNYYSDQTPPANARNFPGLGIAYRRGYAEKDLVDYDTRNIKLGIAFHYKIKNDVEVILASNFGTGTTVYQGDNRYSLKDILFFQNRIEFKKENKFFIRAYATNEDAGKSYDSYFTALRLQQAAKGDDRWAQSYQFYWTQSVPNLTSLMQNWPGFPQWPSNDYATFTDFLNAINPFLNQNYLDSLIKYHTAAKLYADNSAGFNEQPRFEPGTARFDSAFHAITTTLFSEGGSMFYDKSALYHVQGEYLFTPKIVNVVVGGNYRVYAPDSRGTIFQDTGDAVIRNKEFGIYAGLEKKVFKEKLKVNVTSRLDKNENFKYLLSPAMSAVYSFNPKQIVRFSFSSAIRNPTLQDQYLYLHVSPMILLLGNLNGFDSLVTLESAMAAISYGTDSLEYFNVKPIEPEEVKTIELGYRSTLFNNLYMDMVAYYSRYKNFIGYKIGAIESISFSGVFPSKIIRVSANATDEVTTRGVSIGMNYYFKKYFMLNGNYSYNLLDRGGSTDPQIPAYNTPENKYNIGLSGRDIDVLIFKKIHLKNFGFGINYKWVQGFQFEGSPQFTGYVPSYDLVDAQISYHAPKIYSIFKLGASNLLDNNKYTVYGGPATGRLAYFSVLFELTK